MASLVAIRSLNLIIARCAGQVAECKTKAVTDASRSSYWYGKVVAYEDIGGIASMALDAIKGEPA